MIPRIINVPGLPPVKYCVKTARRGCEAYCLVGAVIECIFFSVNSHLFAAILMGKLAFVTGALGVYLLHVEEGLRGSTSE